jgi:hypothetical protein
MFFQSSMGLRKSRCDVPSGTTQGRACPNNIDYIVCDCGMCYFTCAKGATFLNVIVGGLK